MSDDKRRPDSQKSRQELLDEIYLLRDVAGEREQHAQALRAQVDEKDAALAEARGTLAAMLASRSWRLTAPLRAVTKWFAKRSPTGAHAQPAAADSSPADMDSPSTGAKRSVEANTTQPAMPSSAVRHDDTPRLFVDITELALRQGRTGVQRVTREILRAFLAAPPTGYLVQPVAAAAGQPYRLLPGFDANRLNRDVPLGLGAAIAPRPGDVFLGLDHAMQAAIEHAEELAAMHEQGVRLWFVCNDTLPLSRPDWFPPGIHESFKAWFETITRVGDGIACISQATEADVRHWLDDLRVQRDPPLKLGHFHLGSDIAPVEPVLDIAQEQQAVIDRFRGKPSFLMVGTLEPRKGHAQALAAFNQLWARGEDVALVIVGLPGWMTEVTQRRIRHHEEFGKRLFWFMGPDDAVLDHLYSNCTVLLAPSEGEGFGLPLVEAGRHGLPILCRDLPVFHEVAGDCATYFSGDDAAALAAAINRWMGVQRQGGTRATVTMPRLTWAESAQQLLGVVLGIHADASC